MGSTGNKLKGAANEAMRAKQGVGNECPQAKEVRGETQQAKGDVKDTVKKGVDKI